MSTDLKRKIRPDFDPTSWISQSEAAQLRGVSRQAISNLVKKNRFRILTIGGKTLLSRDDVVGYLPKAPGPTSTRKSKRIS